MCDFLFRKNHRLSTSLGDGGSNAVQVTLAVNGDLASTIAFEGKNREKALGKKHVSPQ